MDMSFANQFLSLCRLAKEGGSMSKQVYDITTEQDQDLATTKLDTLGFSIDVLTDAQLAYLDDYTVGTWIQFNSNNSPKFLHEFGAIPAVYGTLGKLQGSHTYRALNEKSDQEQA